MRRFVVVFGLVAVCLSSFVQPAAAAPAGSDRSGHVGVMTRNLYVGADIFRVFDASTPAEVPIVVAGILQTVFATDFPARSAALADEIGRYRPALVGLQEVSLIRVQSPGDFLIGNPQPAETELFDYLDILLAQLAARGLDYRVAGVVENADVELPFLAGFSGGVPLLDDVRLTDRDVILARADVDTSNVQARNYAINFTVPFGATTIDFLRGFVAVDATVHNRTVRFVNTHLEVGSLVPVIQQAQAAELLTELADEELPVILVGDFNSSPEDAFPAPYAQIEASGYTDTWLRRRGRPEDGATCCFTETLDDPTATLSERIDLVWARTGADHPPFLRGIGPVRATVVGEELRDRTDGGLWASDHAGVVAHLVLRFPK